MTDIDRQKMVSKIEKYKEELVSFCADLVKTPSVNGQQDETTIARLIYQRAKKLELPCEIMAKDKKRPNVFVGEDFNKRSGLLFIAHLDTVPAGDERKWKHPPFGAEKEGGKLFGRGAIDCKAGIALSLYALKILSEMGATRAAKFAGVVDEESGASSKLGACFLLEKGLNAQAAIYTYPGIDTVTIGHRGLVRLWIKIQGEALTPALKVGKMGLRAQVRLRL